MPQHSLVEAGRSLAFPQILDGEDDLRRAPRGDFLGIAPDRSYRHVSGVETVLSTNLIGQSTAVQSLSYEFGLTNRDLLPD